MCNFSGFISSAFSSQHAMSSKHVLDNGMTVLIRQMPGNEVISVFALVKTGSATEGEFLGTGISHFFEHMLFKTTKNRAVGQIAGEIQAVGGEINASTSRDYTIYTITVPVEAFDKALDVLSDMLMNVIMDKEEFEKEREVIFAEMRLHNDNPSRRIGQLIYESVYQRHPYRHPIIGYESLLAEVSREDVVTYYENLYAPNNIIFSVAGNVKTEEILPKIKETFKNFQRKRDIPRNLVAEPPQISPRRYEEEYPVKLTRLSIAFPSMSLLHPDLYALDVLAKVLGQGESSRLYVDVYKKQGLVLSISAYNYTPVDKGFFNINALLEYKDVDATIQAVKQHIALITQEGITTEELAKAKKQVLSEHIRGMQATSHVAHSQAIDEAFAGDYDFSQKYVDGIAKVALKDITRVARQYLVDEAMNIVVLKPKKDDAQKEELKSTSSIAGEIQKFTLDNGLTILLREDHTFPLISTRLIFNGGTRQETSLLNGLSRMTASVWIKGTQSRSAQEIAEYGESLGIYLDSYSGTNSFGLSLSCLSQDSDAAFGLLEDIVKNPIFPEDEILKIKEQMLAGIKQRDDNIFQFTTHRLKELLFVQHPFRLEKNGTPESIERITREDLVSFYGNHRMATNMVLSVFGDIKSDQVLAWFTDKFGKLENNPVVLNNFDEPSLENPKELALVMDKEQAMVMFGFHGVAITNHDRYGLEVAASILGSSFSGRLFAHIREELGKAYTLGGAAVPGIDSGFIYFYALTSEENVDQVKGLVIKEIKNLQEVDVTDKELKDIKMYLKGTMKIDHQTNAALSFSSSLDELYGIGFLDYRKYDQYIEAVTQDDIRRLAKKYFNLQKMAVVITTPKR